MARDPFKCEHVDKVNVVTEGGLLCRLFERRDA